MEAPKLEGAAALGYDTGAFQGGFPQGELVPERCCPPGARAGWS